MPKKRGIESELLVIPQETSKKSKQTLETNDIVPGLSLWESNRKERTPVSDDAHTTTIQIRNLNVELTCPVCLGILRNTMTVMECLHRFCEECIAKCLRLGKKECPTCRVKCSSMRNLRADPTFDNLIASVYPNLEDFEAKQESVIEEINRTVLSGGTRYLEEGKRRQAMAKITRATRAKEGSPLSSDAFEDERRKKEERVAELRRKANLERKKLKQQEESTPDRERESEKSKDKDKDKKKHDQGAEISFVLLCSPHETRVENLVNKYLKTSRLITIRHLCKFLSKKFNIDASQFRIGLNPKEAFAEDRTLDSIDNENWKRSDELTLYYHLA